MHDTIAIVDYAILGLWSPGKVDFLEIIKYRNVLVLRQIHENQ